MGVVYRALDPRLERPVALKVLTGAISRDAGAFDRFQREAKTLAALHHPNIATIFSLEEAEGAPFFTMEWIPGTTLAHRLEGGPLPLEETLSVARQVARALEAAHARGVVHRDLKPANVMVTPDGTAKILDFGIAAAFGQAAGFAPSSIAEVSGTPAYMSPEQYGGQAVDPRTDVWSFGCLLYECLSGRPAFGGETLLECRSAVLGAEPAWEILPPATPPRLREILARMLRKEREERLEQIVEARRGLEELLVMGGVAARLAEAEPVTARPATHNLPRSLTRFIGRERLLASIGTELESSPLVTLTGAGGCGKSRVAIEAARGSAERFPDGVWLVELGPISAEERVLPAIAHTLSVRESPGEDLETAVARALEGRRTLILLDNCEHLLGECALRAEALLSRLPDLRVLATSREALGIPGEAVVAVGPLTLPPRDGKFDPEQVDRYESVALFVDRARGVKRDFALRPQDSPAVAQIVRRLDGIPLAIELAAARVKVLPLDEIARRLDDRFRLLTGGSRTALPRQQTLRAAIEWSYDLLAEEERRLLRRLSVFAGGFALSSVEPVCAGEGIEEWEVLDRVTLLVDKSLVEVEAPEPGDEDGFPRYRLLETVREYARERFLADPDVAEVRARHRRHFVSLAEAVEHTGARAASGHRRLDLERDNLRAALEDALAAAENSEDALRLVSALGHHWLIRGHWNEGRDAAERALAIDRDRSPGRLRAQVLGWGTRFVSSQGDTARALELARRALAIEEELGDRPGIAAAWNDLGVIARQRGAIDEARDQFRRSLEIRRELRDELGTAVALHNIALCEMKRHDPDAADVALAESREILRRVGDRQKLAVSLGLAASIAYERADFDGAQRGYEEALELARELGDRRAERNLLLNLGMTAERRDDPDVARRRYEESLAIRRELGDRRGQLLVHLNLARLATLRGDLEEAGRQGSGAVECFSGARGEADGIAATLAPLALRIGAHETAARWSPCIERLAGAEVAEMESDGEVPALLAEIRGSAGADFERLSSEGASLDPERVVDLARTLLSRAPAGRGGNSGA